MKSNDVIMIDRYSFLTYLFHKDRKNSGILAVVDKSILHCSLGCSYKIRKARD